MAKILFGVFSIVFVATLTCEILDRLDARFFNKKTKPQDPDARLSSQCELELADC